MNIKYLIIHIALAFVALSANAADLFSDSGDRSALPFIKGAPVDAETSMGGYPIFHADSSLKIDNVTTSMSGANGSATAINRGALTLKHMEPDGVGLQR